MTTNTATIGILGATGYTGAELLRLLARHRSARVACMTSERFAGQTIDRVFPHLSGRDLPALSKIGDEDLGALDVVFGCLPHGTTQEVIGALPRGPKVVDLSADFRLADPAAYERTYGKPHAATGRQRRCPESAAESKGLPGRRARRSATARRRVPRGRSPDSRTRRSPAPGHAR